MTLILWECRTKGAETVSSSHHWYEYTLQVVDRWGNVDESFPVDVDLDTFGEYDLALLQSDPGPLRDLEAGEGVLLGLPWLWPTGTPRRSLGR